MPAKYSPLQIRLYVTGVVILVAALIGACVIYLTTPAPDSAEQFYAAKDPRYQITLQQIGGTAEVIAAGLHQWFDSLWNGKALAYTVAALGAAAAVVCFLIGHFLAFDLPDERGDERDS
ncbi:hypothetical protein [Paraburkholderia sp.]|uniref:hypothetical protein n=1 Tax=Paraburkholderia sp. TaxID=1926495 RepID=UPI002F4076F3